MKTHKMLLCPILLTSFPPPPPQRSVSIAAVRGAVRPPKTHKIALKFIYNYLPWGPELLNVELILTQVIIV